MSFINGNYNRNANFLYLRQKAVLNNETKSEGEASSEKEGTNKTNVEQETSLKTNRGDYEKLSNEMILSQMNIRVNSVKVNTNSTGSNIVFSKNEINEFLTSSDLVSTYFTEINDGENKGQYTLKDSSLKAFDKNTIISFFKKASSYLDKNSEASSSEKANLFKSIVNKQVDLANEAKSKGVDVQEYINSKLASEIEDGMSKIKSYLNQNPNWKTSADSNGNKILDYNEVKSYLSEHMEWDDNIENKDLFINQYWNQTFEANETRAIDTTSLGETVGDTVTSTGSSIISDITGIAKDITPSIAGDTVTSSFMEGIGNKLLNEKEIGAFVEEYLKTNANATQEEITSAWIKSCGISASNILSTAATASLYAIVAKIALNTAIDTVPTFAKESFGNLKDGFSNLFKGNIGGYFKNMFVKLPITAIRNTGRLVKNLAKNTYQTAADIVGTAGSGVYDTAKTAITGVANSITAIGSGFINGAGKILKGNVFGATASIIGGTVKSAIGAVKTVSKTIGKAVKTIGKVADKVFGNPIKSVAKIGKTVAKTVAKGASSVVKGVAKGATSVVKSVGKTIGKIFKGW